MVIESLFSNLSGEEPRREFQVSVAGKGGGFSATRALCILPHIWREYLRLVKSVAGLGWQQKPRHENACVQRVGRPCSKRKPNNWRGATSAQ